MATGNDNSGTALGGMAITSAISGFGSAYAQSNAYKAKAYVDRSIALVNQQLAEYQAKDALARGDEAAAQAGKKISQVKGAQKAALAGQGIDINFGSAADIQADTELLGALDLLHIKNNAAREAFGYKMSAISAGAQGQFSSMANMNAANNTLLTGLGDIAGGGLKSYYMYKYGSKEKVS